jgi:hypothetical protein
MPYCYYIATYAELEQILGLEACHGIFNPELLNNANADCCLLCTKKSTIRLHDNHALCNACMIGYADSKTQGEFIQIDMQTKNFFKLPCPALNCTHKFACTQYLDVLIKCEHYLLNACRRAGIYNPRDWQKMQLSPDIMTALLKARCYICGTDKPIATLHSGCFVCFCKEHMSSVGGHIVFMKCMDHILC